VRTREVCLSGGDRTVVARVAAVVLAAVLAACAPLPLGGPPTIRVATYNIEAGAGHFDSTITAIRALRADIIGLQEVDVNWSDRSQFRDEAMELGKKLGMDVRFAFIYRDDKGEPRRTPREYGVALLSRFPIESWRNDFLTRLSTQEANAKPARMPGMADAVLVVQGQRVRVFSTHLDYRADPAVRATQVEEVIRYLDAADMPIILTGDLNAPPDAPEIQPLLKRLHDAWGAGKGEGLTYPSDKPVKRIDYVLFSGPWTLRRAAVVDTKVSDHRPVVVDAILRTK
jgi:endonuclease/exonuclease/phosphatase family metal-dependent hydrolase